MFDSEGEPNTTTTSSSPQPTPPKKKALTELQRETALADLLEQHPGKDMPSNPSITWLQEDVFVPEYPGVRSVSLTKVRVKSRGQKDPTCAIAVGQGVLASFKGDAKLLLVCEIKISEKCTIIYYIHNFVMILL